MSDGPLAGPLAWTLAWRMLSGRRSRLLDSTARAALAAVALGVTALGIAMALMTGYRGEIERKLVAGNAAVIVYPLARGEQGAAAVRARIAALPGVTRVEPVLYGQGVLSAAGREAEVTLRGAEPGAGPLSGTADALAVDAGGLAGVVLGDDLARELAVAAGDRVRLAAFGLVDGRPRFSYRTLRVAGLFHIGFSEFDRAWAVLDRGVVRALAGEVPLSFEVALADPSLSDAVAEDLRVRLGADFLITDWKSMNHQLFAALALQQWVLFFLIGLIVVVSTFNVASTLMVLVRERMRDLGVLAALGYRPGQMRRVFLLYGAALGAAGTAAGLAAAVAVSWILTRFEIIHFGPEVAAIYLLRSVPFHLAGRDAAAIAAFALVVVLLACWLPARRAARIDPAAALRYE
ncbi:MAG: FtsX-like permease family protein [Thermoanaerobaculia bacterium]